MHFGQKVLKISKFHFFPKIALFRTLFTPYVLFLHKWGPFTNSILFYDKKDIRMYNLPKMLPEWNVTRMVTQNFFQNFPNFQALGNHLKILKIREKFFVAILATFWQTLEKFEKNILCHADNILARTWKFWKIWVGVVCCRGGCLERSLLTAERGGGVFLLNVVWFKYHLKWENLSISHNWIFHLGCFTVIVNSIFLLPRKVLQTLRTGKMYFYCIQ